MSSQSMSEPVSQGYGAEEYYERCANICEAFSYLKKYSIPFVQKLADRDSLSYKQTEAIFSIANRARQIENMFEQIGEIDNEFITSVKEQFMRRGDLSDNQVVALQRFIDRKRR